MHTLLMATLVVSAVAFSHECLTTTSIQLAISQNFADPSLIHTNAGWYAFSTTNKILNIPVAESPDFVTWTVQEGVDALPLLAEWIYAPSPAVAAPDVSKLENGGYLMLFDATPTNNTYRRCVGAATSDDPAGPYTPMSTPVVCGDNPYGFIDPSSFINPRSGQRYILYKLDGANPGPQTAPLPRVASQIFLQEVSTIDGTTLIGDAVSILQSVGDSSDYGTVEAPSLIRNPHGAGFVLFYSSGFYQNSTYTVSYATSNSITGPYDGRSVLLATGDDGLNAPGGADVSKHGKRMVFHANAEDTFNDVRYMYTADLAAC